MFGKRCDGRRIKNLEPFTKIMPYLMVERNDSQNFFEEQWFLEDCTQYMKKVKEEKNINLSYMNVVVAALGRALNERPQINRFVVNRKIYARDKVEISFVVKRGMTDEGEETSVKLEILPQDTIFDVQRKMKDLIEDNKQPQQNSTDKLAKTLLSFPSGILKFLIGIIKWLDNHEMLPKAFAQASPFHSSAFITNVGSIGIGSIYHHIYNFGTISIFMAIGKKKERLTESGNKKYINLKMVTDERICDGKYYASTFQQIYKYINNPELLETPLEEKVLDVK